MVSEETLTLLSQITGRPMLETDAGRLFTRLNKEDTFAPSALISGLLDALELRYDETLDKPMADDPGHLFADILARDKHTGYYIHPSLRTLYLDFAITRSGLPHQEKKNFLILGDYFNLSSVNEAIGRGTTNDVMATICGIYLDCMTKAGVVDCLYHRSMGDEVTMIAVNTDMAKVQKGLRAAEKLTGEFIRALGLERLRHKKYPKHTGAGLVMAVMALKPTTNHRTLKQQLDELVIARKKSRGFGGWGLFRSRGVEAQQFHTRASEQRIDRVLYKYRTYRLGPEFSTEAQQATSTRSSLNPATALLVGRAIAWPRDDRIEYLEAHHDDSKIMLRADIYNLGGLNAVYGHDGADHVKAHLVRILYGTITGHCRNEPRIFDCGGGIIDIVIDHMPQEHIDGMIRAIQSNIYHQILSSSIGGYANAYNLSFTGSGNIMLSQLPHPRGDYSGTGLIMATHAVAKAYSLPEIIERLDKISNRTKMHEMAYVSRDANNIVWGLPLNSIAEPVRIGPDRPQPDAHYLPFTDALRDYLQTKDLPGIFERPVGQICEILFGTDMQAVLGFKKAIRMLQEKNIPDNEIESLDSYTAMDKALKQNNLPPLSVVSTQNRPAFIRNERAAFKTMTLAEKLEHLPKGLTTLIVQTQACFRILHLAQPRGRLSPFDSVPILKEELALPETITDEMNFSTCLYRLARLLDRSYAIMGRDVPSGVLQTLADYSLDILAHMAASFATTGQPLLSKKLHDFVQNQPTAKFPPAHRWRMLQEAVPALLDKMAQRHLLEPEILNALTERFAAFMQQLTVCRDDTLFTVRRGQ